MKVFDSGMPDESYWNSLFDIPGIINWLALDRIAGPVVEIGCGYARFTEPVAQGVKQKVYAFDIEQTMLLRARENALRAGVSNVQFVLRDVVEQGTGLESSFTGLVLLFNILHFPEWSVLLKEAARILKPAGEVAIIHWRKDIATSRGPSVELRPDEGMILESIQGLLPSSMGMSVVDVGIMLMAMGQWLMPMQMRMRLL
jgi:ubiquinone/menaquinone biosynthesis C-methylase UbiE